MYYKVYSVIYISVQFSKELLKGTIEIIVLNSLKELGESYGYQLVKTINSASGNLFEFQEGTLYPLLYRLEDKGRVKSTKKIAPSGKERRYYSITLSGKRALNDRRDELKFFVKGLKQALRLSLV
jgi:PadR family transcriptional regulator PadR